MTPEIDECFAAVRAEYGADSLDRVEEMLEPRRRAARHPMQRGAKWILPGISQQAWHDPYAYPELLPVVHGLEEAYVEIRQDQDRAWETRRREFSDYEHYLVRQEDWRAHYLYRDGRLNERARDVAPTAYRIISERAVAPGVICPLLESHLSTLLPGSAIKAHCDLWNFSINLHFAIDIPEGAAIKVAGETRTWEEGKCLLFDYSFEHEAWNAGTRPRTCLLADLWHPETTLAERRALVVLMTEIQKMMAGL